MLKIGERYKSYAPPESATGRVGTIAATELIRCVVASTSIPGVLPSQRITMYVWSNGTNVEHDFVDGGVLNNTPVHIAIDAVGPHT